jgi:CheY-like chemotaxis protein
MPTQDTVLIVEDMVEVRETLYEGLSFYGYRVITAASMQEAEEALQRLGVAEIDLVIADINLTPDPKWCIRQVHAAFGSRPMPGRRRG